MQTPDAKIENNNELIDTTPKETLVPSPKKISLNVEPLPLKEEELEEPTLQALDVSSKEFKSFFNDYLGTLDKEMRESFADSELCLKQMSNGYEPHYLALKRGQG